MAVQGVSGLASAPADLQVFRVSGLAKQTKKILSLSEEIYLRPGFTQALDYAPANQSSVKALGPSLLE
jgi:hypothetical protein